MATVLEAESQAFLGGNFQPSSQSDGIQEQQPLDPVTEQKMIELTPTQPIMETPSIPEEIHVDVQKRDSHHDEHTGQTNMAMLATPLQVIFNELEFSVQKAKPKAAGEPSRPCAKEEMFEKKKFSTI